MKTTSPTSNIIFRETYLQPVPHPLQNHTLAIVQLMLLLRCKSMHHAKLTRHHTRGTAMLHKMASSTLKAQQQRSQQLISLVRQLSHDAVKLLCLRSTCQCQTLITLRFGQDPNDLNPSPERAYGEVVRMRLIETPINGRTRTLGLLWILSALVEN